jgi:hypothetical protein
MKYSANQASCQWFSGLATPIALVVTAGVLLGVDVCRPANLSASVVPDPDTDGDGLVDRQERVLGTLSSSVDSDQDGFSDAEELARQTSPTYPQFYPEVNSLSVGLTAHGERDGLHAVIAVYLPNGNPRDVDIHIGTLVGRRVLLIPQPLFEAESTVRYVPARDPQALIAIVDFRFDRSLVYATGHLTMFTTVARRGAGNITAADAIDLFDIAGVVALAMPDPSQNQTLRMGRRSASGQGTVYKPLTGGGDDIPTGWASDQICYQTSQPVAVNGAVVTHEVVSAECVSGWDGSCPPTCSSSVGSTFNSVDPVILIGG